MLRLLMAMLIPLAGLAPVVAGAQTDDRAGVVVRYADGEVREMCLFLPRAEVTGAELLAGAGFELRSEEYAIGRAICQIDRTGCAYPDEPCFCDTPNFWSYWTRDPGDDGWTKSEVGASDRVVAAGSVDAWSWGEEVEPPDRSFDQVCPAGAGTELAVSRNEPVSGDRDDLLAFGVAALGLATMVVVAGRVRQKRR